MNAKFLLNSCEIRVRLNCVNVRVNGSVNVIFCEFVCEFQNSTKVHFQSP